MLLDDRIAIVTGGANGIGRATVLAFAAEGARVVVADLNEAAGRQVVDEVAAAGGEARFERVDVSDGARVEQMVESTEAAWGGLDILVNNAGIVADASLLKMTHEQWRRVIDVNLEGLFLCGQAAARRMVELGGGGVILNTASVVGLYGNYGQSNYVAAKAGVIGMTKTWARELGKHGIRVNAVAPGFIATDILEGVPQKILDDMVARTPLRRLGRPEDVADAFVFLASDRAAYVTGTTLSVDGGIVV